MQVKQSFGVKLCHSTVMIVTIRHIQEAHNLARNNEEEPHPRLTTFKIMTYVDLIVQHFLKPFPEHRRETLLQALRGLRHRQVPYISCLMLPFSPI